MLECSRIAVFGGIYSNHLALAAALSDARRRGVDQVFCLGDLGAFGPHPDRVFPILRKGKGLHHVIWGQFVSEPRTK